MVVDVAFVVKLIALEGKGNIKGKKYILKSIAADVNVK